jgi:hypothetical protein
MTLFAGGYAYICKSYHIPRRSFANLTCLAIAVIDFPEKKNSFLSPEERHWVIARLANDRGDVEPDPWTAKKLLQYVSYVLYY